ncbi:hypothetical protein DY000_02058989 [Brassica cretica]|uniref:Uncharacterized protein n=1 Tax=Brassica cretica TaxID=69181 RepID=A0ABQ7B2M0_BRACR|nr:hypothetical protein DY000_02058989 [Brassica cretica]
MLGSFDLPARMEWMEIKLGFSGDSEGESAVGEFLNCISLFHFWLSSMASDGSFNSVKLGVPPLWYLFLCFDLMTSSGGFGGDFLVNVAVFD